MRLCMVKGQAIERDREKRERMLSPYIGSIKLRSEIAALSATSAFPSCLPPSSPTLSHLFLSISSPDICLFICRHLSICFELYMHSPSLRNAPLLPYVAPRPSHTRTPTGAFLNAAVSTLSSPIDAFGSLNWKLPEMPLGKESLPSSPSLPRSLMSPLTIAVPVAERLSPTHDNDLWSHSPLFQSHSITSPRQRFGFTRGTFSISEIVQSYPISEIVHISPPLPVTSPQTSKLGKRIIRSKSPSFLNMGFISPQTYWITLYFAFNLVLTLYNKGVLMHFPFPYSLTALHALFGSVGGFLLMHYGTYIPAQLSFHDHVSLALFSVLYAVNIAVSNVSLHLVTVPVSILFQCTAVF